jgi:hypothetical protein
MRFVRRLSTIVLCLALVAFAEEQGNSWKRVRYNGGTIASKVNPKDWNNRLTVTSDLILFELKDGQKAEIKPKSVTSLSYGQEAHRRVGTMIALAILVSPVALFGLMHKTRLHFIGIQFTTLEGKTGGLLLQGDKDNYRAILVALQSVTGVPVTVSDKEREFVPVGVTTNVAKGPEEPTPPEKPTSSSATAAEGAGTVSVVSSPDGADVYADGQFVGNAPATLKLSPGKHLIAVKMDGYKDWSREITVQTGSDVKLTATLEK